ncbi:MAG TPA: ATP-binding protein [Cyclobacteriaceae bacterium]|nr:ATP-binding protein [Cyclobacteriaceae bacterium]
MLPGIIKRTLYLDKIRPFVGKNLIKVIVGQRRVGKSALLMQIINEIKAENTKANIIYINKELYEFENVKSYQDLIAYAKHHHKLKVKNYLFVDEIQDIEDFEKALRSLLAENNFDIYITGSNAFLLSGELATFLSGRYIEIKVYGLSYTEFLDFHQRPNNAESFNLYCRYGGMPYLINLPLSDETVYEYLKNIYSAILFKDVARRHQIRNIALLESLVYYVADNIGSLLSAKNISDFLKSQKVAVSPNIILNYLAHLEEAFLVQKISRSEIAGKKILEIGQKYYLQDLGLRHSLLGYRGTDIGKILENIVLLHLLIAGYKVFVGKLQNKEVDFVCERGGEKLYVQVAYSVSDESTRKREFGNLLLIEDNYPKIVVSMDEYAEGDIEGIQHLQVRNFLTVFLNKGAV